MKNRGKKRWKGRGRESEGEKNDQTKGRKDSKQVCGIWEKIERRKGRHRVEEEKRRKCREEKSEMAEKVFFLSRKENEDGRKKMRRRERESGKKISHTKEEKEKITK